MGKDFVWWRDGIVYQIYPRSFVDSNGDGIGDLPGIISKLDYLLELGIDAIWLSPINPSPDADFGYDVSDYWDIDPKFGTMQDFETLIYKAEQRGIRIVMDLVLNHTSTQHPWFLSAKMDRKESFHDYYLWREGNGKKKPNHWLSAFGGSAWEWNQATQEYYYHMWYKEQADVNWRNPNVRRSMIDVFRFWLDKGVKGFRLDVFNMYFKDAAFRDNPINIRGLRPFDWQDHIFDCDRPEMLGVLAEIRNLLDQYDDTYVVGETFLSTPQKAASYCGSDFLHAAFNFDILNKQFKPSKIKEFVIVWEKALGEEKWPTYVLNNHDTQRSASRFCHGEDDERLKLAIGLLLTLRGTPYLYYGEEIGMRDVAIERKDIRDPVGRRYWPFYKGRDRCRTPMQWDDSDYAGFSSVKPWLPIHDNYHHRNTAAQAQKTDSLLNLYRKLIALRKEFRILQRGDFQFVDGWDDELLVYKRRIGAEGLLMVLNFSSRTREINVNNELIRAADQLVFSSEFQQKNNHSTARKTILGNEMRIYQFNENTAH